MSDRVDRSRISWLTAIFGAFVFILILRLYYLQVIHTEYYSEKAHSNRTRHVRDRAQRGRIVDRNGVILAAAKPTFSLYITPEDFPHSLRDQIYARVSRITGIPVKRIRDRFFEHRTARFRPRKIAGNLSYEQVVHIESNRFHLPGVSIKAENARAYPFQSLLCHVLGYVGEISSQEIKMDLFSGYRVGDIIGKSGIEKTFESYLNGQDGYRWVEVDATGREGHTLRYPAPIQAVQGMEVRLTIDMDLQIACEQFLSPWKGSIVVMDPRNGDVLAMVSYPGFDPNWFATGITSRQWNEIIQHPHDPLLNRSLQFEAPPGSIFKLITGFAALRESTSKPLSTYHCNGTFNYSNHLFKCWNAHGHGHVDIVSALESSCNVYFYQAGLAAGIDLIARTARDFGLGSVTGIPLAGERPGLMPDRKWKKQMFADDWWPGETISVSIGQGGVIVTPIQAACVMAMAANKGIMHQPRIVSDVIGHTARESRNFKPVISHEIRDFKHWDLILSGLQNVVAGQNGTAKSLRMREMSIAGKTGTAQVISAQALKRMGITSESETDPKHLDHNWFAGFGPVEDPRVVVVVMIENGGKKGAKEKFSMAKKVFQKWFELNHSGRDGPELPEPDGTDT